MSDNPTTTPKAVELAKAVDQVDADKAAKAAAKAEAPVEQTSARRGIYVVYNPEDKPIAAYSAEIKAMRAAMSIKGSAKFVEYGQPFNTP